MEKEEKEKLGRGWGHDMRAQSHKRGSAIQDQREGKKGERVRKNNLVHTTKKAHQMKSETTKKSRAKFRDILRSPKLPAAQPQRNLGYTARVHTATIERRGAEKEKDGRKARNEGRR